jgi:hypothetical protein
MKILRRALVAAMALGALMLTSSIADAGCYRMGETGYHHYRSCWGPSFLYPHRRHCHYGHCYYH